MDDSDRRPEGDSSSAPNDGTGRRGFIALTVVGTCAIAGTIGIPAALFVVAPAGNAAEGGKKFVVGKLDDLVVGTPKKVSIIGDETDAWTISKGRRLGAVWLLRVADRDVRGLSVICPHLGCGVEVSADQKGFGCPCHDSVFDLQGNRVSGPAPRGMDPLPVVIGADGALTVTFVRYRTGIEARQEIG